MHFAVEYLMFMLLVLDRIITGVVCLTEHLRMFWCPGGPRSTSQLQHWSVRGLIWQKSCSRPQAGCCAGQDRFSVSFIWRFDQIRYKGMRNEWVLSEKWIPAVWSFLLLCLAFIFSDASSFLPQHVRLVSSTHPVPLTRTALERNSKNVIVS